MSYCLHYEACLSSPWQVQVKFKKIIFNNFCTKKFQLQCWIKDIQIPLNCPHHLLDVFFNISDHRIHRNAAYSKDISIGQYILALAN